MTKTERLFEDRREAGRTLAKLLLRREDLRSPVVLALPRGGVPVAAEVAAALGAPLDIVLVRKLGVPDQPELAMGAIGLGGVRVMNLDVVRGLGIPDAWIRDAVERETLELERRERFYRGGRPGIEIRGRTAILVDDGLATGSSMFAAVQAVRTQEPARVLVAVPVAPPDTVERLKGEVDGVLCVATPERFLGVGAWYRSFPQLSDEAVRRILEDAAQALALAREL
jgi:putative phosphoribosyl transferase